MGKTIAIIPARGGSKRLPSKNTKLLGNLPLLAYSINYAIDNSNIIDAVYVSTDDEDIKRIAIQYGARVIDRPIELSGDLEPTVTAIKHSIEVVENVSNIILLQPTNPFRPKTLLNEAFKVYIEENADSLFTVSSNHKKLGKIVDDQFVPFNYSIGQRSQDLEPLYFENGLLYITKAALIQEEIIFNDKSIPFVVNHKYVEVDIDTQDDFDYAEYVLKNYNEE
ncbi:acylneuraminate cytidylyltransferase family protein [Winogradskyella echinorum]|uniref:Acylneuraminate cytidylyltransferase family protein n=1 Tax=Winogradskyella echinorum TaxID=538189 RepID=A0ABR6Y2L3_9FLAO|nr:acylneuraminate cytidylyltransferase family protein [Winogradskyella echinorum]MBC3846945.1 acylneuraminate cytidylyltransferase family protein [Winogradskyella echinorum]MBC5751293.1 acylneuraminate cytidylyltransferase family protein [Winogradskyella echinorum]